MRLLLCGGGTAGHINPAIAVAEELIESQKDAKVLFVGREGGKENQLIEKAGFNLKTINIQGLKRKLTVKNFTVLRNAIKSVAEAKRIIRDFKPDVILGTGGYVCWPVIMAGKKLGIPTTIHESNVVPGLTTKLLSRITDMIFLNAEETKAYLSKKARTKTVGNPLRKDFRKISRSVARKKLKLQENELLIVSFGGSIGAEKINEVILDVMKKYSSKQENITHIHAVGKRYYSKIAEVKSGLKSCKILPYIDDMPLYLNAADIAICRSGSMTVSEICEVGVPSILIPSPNVTANHQLANAKRLEQANAAIVLEEKNLTSQSLINAINQLKSEKYARKNAANLLKSLSTQNSAKHIVSELFLIKNCAKV